MRIIRWFLGELGQAIAVLTFLGGLLWLADVRRLGRAAWIAVPAYCLAAGVVFVWWNARRRPR